MAVTGKSTVRIEPGPRKVGALVVKLPEVSSATYPAGCLVSKSEGMLRMHTTGYVSANLFGVALASGKNGSADRAKTNQAYRFERDRYYKGVVSGSVASSQLGATVALSQNTAGNVFLITAATASDSSGGRIVDFAEGFAAGDTNPVVFFVPLSGAIQEG